MFIDPELDKRKLSKNVVRLLKKGFNFSHCGFLKIILTKKEAKQCLSNKNYPRYSLS